MTFGVSKQLLPIFDRPMLYYIIDALKNAGVKDFLVITTFDQQSDFKKDFSDGTSLDVFLSYTIQDDLKGIAEAYHLKRISLLMMTYA